jgi:hypothetical protein
MRTMRRSIYRWLIVLAGLLSPALASSAICVDEFMIVGARTIPLLPNESFKVHLQSDLVLIDRAGFFLKLSSDPSSVPGSTRYSVVFLDELYFFELRQDVDSNWRWTQYADDQLKRGFGGSCVLSDQEALLMQQVLTP